MNNKNIIHVFDFDETLFYNSTVEFGLVPGHYVSSFKPCGYDFTTEFIDFLGNYGIQTSRQKGNACILDYDNYESFRSKCKKPEFVDTIKSLKSREDENGVLKRLTLMHFFEDNKPNYLPLSALETLKVLLEDGEICYILTARNYGKGCEEAIRTLSQHGIRLPTNQVVCCGTSKKGPHMMSIINSCDGVHEIRYYENSEIAIEDVKKHVPNEYKLCINKYRDDKVENLGSLEYSSYRSVIPECVKISRSRRGKFNAWSKMKKLSGLSK